MCFRSFYPLDTSRVIGYTCSTARQSRNRVNLPLPSRERANDKLYMEEMMKTMAVCLLLLVAFPFIVYGQPTPRVWLLNLEAPQNTESGLFQVRLAHRFTGEAFDHPFSTWFGSDEGAAITAGIGYGLSQDITVSVDRSSMEDTWRLGGKILMYSTADDKLVVSSIPAVLLRAEKPESDNTKAYSVFGTFCCQADPIRSLSLLALPSVSLHRGEFHMGLACGASYRITEVMSAVGELGFPLTGDYKGDKPYWALGTTVQLYNHTFSIMMSNTTGFLEQALLGSDDTRARFGFNLTRNLRL
jgi:hypothetical protein